MVKNPPSSLAGEGSGERDLTIPAKLILGLFILLIAYAQPCTASQRKVVVVVANRLLLSDFDNSSLSTITKMFHDGSAALISPNCFGPKNEYSVLLTAGAGAACRGGAYMRQCFDAMDKTPEGLRAGDVYSASTGYSEDKNSGVFLGLGPALRDNRELSRPIMLGALGEALRKAGKKTCAIGNADIHPNGINRSVAVLAMDSHGLISSSRVGLAPLSLDEKNGLGLLSDAKLLAKETKEELRTADFVVVDFGDFARLDEAEPQFSEKAFASYRSTAMRQLDSLLSELLAGSKNTTFILVSFSPSLNGQWDHLTPLVVYPSKKPGLLVSPTTRTPGLIAASDFAPTVLKLMAVSSSGEMLGREAKQISANNNIAVLREMDTRVSANHTLIWPILWTIAIIGAVSLTIASVSIAFSFALPRWVYPVLRLAMVVSACYPLAMLLAVLAPAGMSGYPAGTAISTALLTLICFGAASLIGKKYKVHGLPVLIAFGLTTIIIVADIISGGTLCKFAVPSSFQLAGFRYYGIGNEYAGILISMSAVVAIFASGKNRAKSTAAAIIIGAIVTSVLGFGMLGANYGATIASVVTFGLIAMSMWRGRFGLWHVIVMLALGLIVSMGFAFIDSKISGASATHAGRVAGLVHKFGDQYVLALVLRKILLNVQLTVAPQTQKAYLAFSPFLALWFYGVQGKIRHMLCKNQEQLAGLKGIVFGMLAAFLFNDSGIVFANIMIAMTVLILLYSLLDGFQASRPLVKGKKNA